MLLNCNAARYHEFLDLYGHIHLTASRIASHFPDPDKFLGVILYWRQIWASLSPTRIHTPSFVFMQRKCEYTLGTGATAEHLKNYIQTQPICPCVERSFFLSMLRRNVNQEKKAGGDLSSLSTGWVKSVMMSLILLWLKSPDMLVPFSVNQYN